MKRLRDELRALPPAARESLELQARLGKLLHANEQFDAAEEAFAEGLAAAAPRVASGNGSAAAERAAIAEAHFSRFHNALQRKDLDGALAALNAAAELRPDLYRLVPQGYVPEKILGAGGFGVAILCRHPHLKRKRVIKALFATDGESDRAFAEAEHLADLDHEHIIKVHNCAYVDPVERRRPYLELEWFDGVNLEAYVQAHHPLPEAASRRSPPPSPRRCATRMGAPLRYSTATSSRRTCWWPSPAAA